MVLEPGDVIFVRDIKMRPFGNRKPITYRGYIRIEEISRGVAIVSTPFPVLLKDCTVSKLFRVKVSTIKLARIIGKSDVEPHK